MYPLLIIENLYRQQPDRINHVYVTNTQKIKENKEFISIVGSLDIVKESKTSFESRFPIVDFLEKYTDVVVSHQWENALNYAYLDAVYLGYPLVHNAHLCKDCGYYYEGFDVGAGTKKLEFALNEHDKNLAEYKEKNKKVMARYLATNPESVATYDKLIANLFK